MPTAQDVFDSSVKPLSLRERLRLAALILQDLSQADLVAEGDSWSEDDERDLTAFSLGYAAAAYPEDEEVA
jgi:hypothetical protein